MRMWHLLNGKLCSEPVTITVSSKSTWITILIPVAMASAAIIAISMLMVVATVCSIDSAQAVRVNAASSFGTQAVH